MSISYAKKPCPFRACSIQKEIERYEREIKGSTAIKPWLQ